MAATTLLLNLLVGLTGAAIQTYFLEQPRGLGWNPAEEREIRAF